MGQTKQALQGRSQDLEKGGLSRVSYCTHSARKIFGVTTHFSLFFSFIHRRERVEQTVISFLWPAGARKHYRKPQQSQPRECGGEPPSCTFSALHPDRKIPPGEDATSGQTPPAYLPPWLNLCQQTGKVC